MQVIMATYSKFQLPFFTLVSSMYTIIYIYAVLGQFWFSGLITTKSQQTEDPNFPALYYLMNFNDFTMSMVTLFHILVINNWFITCDMCCKVVGNDWPRAYFITFWIVTVLIMVNLVISFVLEIYAEMDEKYSKAHKRIRYILKLKGEFTDRKGEDSSSDSGESDEFLE